MMAARIFGKPFVITEFNFVKPNLYRAEGGPLIGAYSALQDWDGLYRFAWSHSRNSVVGINPPTMFDAANDPLVQLSDRIAVLMFRRGDVEAAREKYAIAVPDDLSMPAGCSVFRKLRLFFNSADRPNRFVCR